MKIRMKLSISKIAFLLFTSVIFVILDYYIITDQLNIVTLLSGGDNQYKIFANLFKLATDNFFGYSTFLHPNWWIVVLTILAVLVIIFLVVNYVLLNYRSLHESLDVNETPLCNVSWTICYFGICGAFAGFSFNTSAGVIHTFLLLVGFTYLFVACFYGTDIRVKVIRTPIILLLDVLVYAVCLVLVYIIIIAVVCYFFKSMQVAGSVTRSASAVRKYNEEADELNQEKDRLLNESSPDLLEVDNLVNKINEHNFKGE